MALYYFQLHQLNDETWYLLHTNGRVDASRSSVPLIKWPSRDRAWRLGRAIKSSGILPWKIVPDGTLGSVPTPGMQQDAPTWVDEARAALVDSYQGHLEDGSSVQKHSAGGIYPYVIFAQETLTGIAYGVIGPKKPNGVLVGAYHRAVEYAVNLKGGA